MKNFYLHIFTIIIFAAVLPVFSQDANKWLRIEFENKRFSVAVPQTNIIDPENRDLGQRFRLIAFENGVEMEILHTKSNFGPALLSAADNFERARKGFLGVGDFTILRFNPLKTGGGIQRALMIFKDNNSYLLMVRSKTGAEKVAERFFLSIRLEGEALLVKNEETNYQDEAVAVSKLKSSPEIVEAEKRKTGNFKGTVTYELMETDNYVLETENLTHRAVIVEKPFPRHNSTTGFTGELEPLKVRLKVQFRADGQIGDIVVLSNADENFTKNAIGAARRIKFVPARRGGESVDSFQIVKYSMIAVPSSTITIK